MLTRLKIVRLQHGVRQWELAKRVGIPETKLSRIETGREPLPPDLAQQLAKELGVLVTDIWTEAEHATA